MSQAEDQHAGGEWIERACMPDFDIARKAALDRIDGVARGDADRLIDHQDSIHRGVHLDSDRSARMIEALLKYTRRLARRHGDLRHLQPRGRQGASQGA